MTVCVLMLLIAIKLPYMPNLAMPLSVRLEMRVGRYSLVGSWWREIGMYARWLAAGPDGSVRKLLA